MTTLAFLHDPIYRTSICGAFLAVLAIMLTLAHMHFERQGAKKKALYNAEVRRREQRAEMERLTKHLRKPAATATAHNVVFDSVRPPVVPVHSPIGSKTIDDAHKLISASQARTKAMEDAKRDTGERRRASDHGDAADAYARRRGTIADRRDTDRVDTGSTPSNGLSPDPFTGQPMQLPIHCASERPNSDSYTHCSSVRGSSGNYGGSSCSSMSAGAGGGSDSGSSDSGGGGCGGGD